MEVFVQPSVVDVEDPPSWEPTEEVRVRVAGGHEFVVRSTKDGIEAAYVAPKNKKPGLVSTETTAQGASLKVKL